MDIKDIMEIVEEEITAMCETYEFNYEHVIGEYYNNVRERLDHLQLLDTCK